MHTPPQVPRCSGWKLSSNSVPWANSAGRAIWARHLCGPHSDLLVPEAFQVWAGPLPHVHRGAGPAGTAPGHPHRTPPPPLPRGGILTLARRQVCWLEGRFVGWGWSSRASEQDRGPQARPCLRCLLPQVPAGAPGLRGESAVSGHPTCPPAVAPYLGATTRGRGGRGQGQCLSSSGFRLSVHSHQGGA